MPAKKPQDHKKKARRGTTSAKAWKKSNVSMELELPSGNVCLARNPGIEHFLAQGTIPNSLMPIVLKGLKAAEEGQDAVQMVEEELEPTPEVLADVLTAIDNAVLQVVVEPTVLPAPENEEDRDEELLYVDEVDIADKLFIFQWAVGGTSDLEQFRSQSEGFVAPLSEGLHVGAPTQPAPGD